jgi:hypothetical protein
VVAFVGLRGHCELESLEALFEATRGGADR